MNSKILRLFKIKFCKNFSTWEKLLYFSLGILINQFLVERTNRRTDEWGGSAKNRMRFAIEIVRRTRQRLGENFILIYRLSLVDLVEQGQVWPEVVELAKQVESVGATILNSGIGWHEAKIPTIATMVPRATFAGFTAKLRAEVNIPVVTSNRINMPDVAEQVLVDGHAGLVSMARPMLADPDLVLKALEGRTDGTRYCFPGFLWRPRVDPQHS